MPGALWQKTRWNAERFGKYWRRERECRRQQATPAYPTLSVLCIEIVIDTVPTDVRTM